MSERWFDEEAGPVVRPYAMTRGRTRGADDQLLDMVAIVTAHPARPKACSDPLGVLAEGIGPEHVEILRRCGRHPQAVAELAADLDLPIGVVRVLLSDLLEAGLVRVSLPGRPTEAPDARMLREVIDGLRSL